MSFLTRVGTNLCLHKDTLIRHVSQVCDLYVCWLLARWFANYYPYGWFRLSWNASTTFTLNIVFSSYPVVGLFEPCWYQMCLSPLIIRSHFDRTISLLPFHLLMILLSLIFFSSTKWFRKTGILVAAVLVSWLFVTTIVPGYSGLYLHLRRVCGNEVLHPTDSLSLLHYRYRLSGFLTHCHFVPP